MSSNIRVQKNCFHCANEFTAKTPVTKFCSGTCSKRNYKKRKREGKNEISNVETSTKFTEPILNIQIKEFISLPEAGKLLGVSRRILWRAVKDGCMNVIRLGRRVVISRAEIDRIAGINK